MALSEALIPPLKNESDLETYTYRWAVLVMFILAGVANALILLSFSPITNLAESYWGVSITAVNLLTVSFQIMYLPGTVLALYISKYYDLRTLMLSGGLLTLVGCGVRYIGAVSKGDNGLNNDGSYGIILLGTFIVAAAQPFYLNMPARIAAVWFPLKERDISTTFGSLANPLGSAIGSVIPPLFVTETNLNGVKDLLLCHLVVAAVTFSLTLVAFRSQPPKPPTLSAMAMGESLKSEGSNNLKAELFKLFENKNYLFLLFSFTISLSNLNALAALLNQLPGEYDNGQVGLTGAALILSGFLGAFVAGFVLNYTKAYRTILKATYSAAFVAWVIFMCSCGKGNFPFFISGAVLLGLTLLPTSEFSIVFQFLAIV